MQPHPRVVPMIVAAVAAASCAWVALAAPPTDAEILSKADVIAAAFLQKPGAVGLSIGVARKGRVIVAKSYGLADAELDVAANKDTMFRIGSVTKQFTAAAIMRLAEQGKLSLDDDAGKYLPEVPLKGHAVTIRQLLNHTSGIPNYTDLEAWGRVIPLELTHEQVLALVKETPFDFNPGEGFAYNNTAYHMLGMIIEKLSGVSYAQYMQDEFFTPLRLGRTRCDSNSTLMKNRAQGYTLQDGKLVNDLPFGTSQPFAAGTLLSTGEDLVKWSMALASGRVVKPESLAQMSTPTVLPSGENTRLGLGMEIDECEGRRLFRHGGLIFGFNAMLLWLPDEDVHIAVISNGQPLRSSVIATTLLREVLGIQNVVAKDVPVPPDLVQRIRGDYTLWGRRVTIYAEGGKAMMKDQDTFAIYWQGPLASGGNEFRASFDHNVKLVFAPDGQSFALFDDSGQTRAKRTNQP